MTRREFDEEMERRAPALLQAARRAVVAAAPGIGEVNAGQAAGEIVNAAVRDVIEPVEAPTGPGRRGPWWSGPAGLRGCPALASAMRGEPGRRALSPPAARAG